MRPSLAAAAGVLALAWASPACPEPLSLDIILGLERFGRVAIDPSGAVGVFEERRARSDLPRHDLPAESAIRQARLYRIDLDAPGLPRPLLPMAKDAGYTLGAFSPTGRSLVVYRLQDEIWRLGLVEMASGRVTWTTVSPDLGLWGRAVAWTSDDTLVALGMTHGRLPPRLSGSRLQQQRLQALRAAATAGEAAAVSVGLDDRSDALEPRRLWRIDAATGQATAIADGPYLDVETSPDGRYAALLRDGPLLPPPDLDHPTEVRRARSLEIVALDTGVIVRPPEARNISTSLLAWSPTSHALLVAAIDADPARLLAIAPNGLVQDVTPPGVQSLGLPEVRTPLPDLNALRAAADGDLSALGDLADRAETIRRETRLYTAPSDDLSEADAFYRDSLERAGARTARDLALGEAVDQASDRRRDGLETLRQALDTAPNARAVLDLEARLAAEQALIQNEQLRMQGLPRGGPVRHGRDGPERWRRRHRRGPDPTARSGRLGRLLSVVVAPGERIDGPLPNLGFGRLDGTSMSAPHVSGVAALLMARHPELVSDPRRVKAIIISTATDLGRERHFQGAGLVDALRALQSV